MVLGYLLYEAVDLGIHAIKTGYAGGLVPKGALRTYTYRMYVCMHIRSHVGSVRPGSGFPLLARSRIGRPSR